MGKSEWMGVRSLKEPNGYGHRRAWPHGDGTIKREEKKWAKPIIE